MSSYLFTSALRSIIPLFMPKMNHIECRSILPSYSKLCYWNMHSSVNCPCKGNKEKLPVKTTLHIETIYQPSKPVVALLLSRLSPSTFDFCSDYWICYTAAGRTEYIFR